MIIHFKKTFLKRYNKLDFKTQVKIDQKIQLFKENPYNSALYNHKLKGFMQGKRAFAITSDIRIIFEEFENYTLVLFLDLGSHNQVY